MSDPKFRPSHKGDLVVKVGGSPMQWYKENGVLKRRVVNVSEPDVDTGDMDALIQGLSKKHLVGPRSGFGSHVASRGSLPSRDNLPGPTGSDSFGGPSQDDLGVYDDSDVDVELADDLSWQMDRDEDGAHDPYEGYDQEDFWDMSVHDSIIGEPGSSSHRNGGPVFAELDDIFEGESDTFNRRKL